MWVTNFMHIQTCGIQGPPEGFLRPVKAVHDHLWPLWALEWPFRSKRSHYNGLLMHSEAQGSPTDKVGPFVFVNKEPSNPQVLEVRVDFWIYTQDS